ncbi:MAG: hypothetical protein ABIN96_16135, partial [Rubrivivax sp.]
MKSIFSISLHRRAGRTRSASFAAFALAAATALGALLPLGASAQEDPRAQLRAAVRSALTPILGDSAEPIVQRLMQVQPQGAISRNFDLSRVTRALFDRATIATAPDCRTTKSRLGEAAEDVCVIDVGERDSGAGAYSMLAYSKNIGIGDVMYASRPAFNPLQPTLPTPVRLTDQQAYD